MPPADYYINHSPKHRNCSICNQCKIQNTQARRIKEDDGAMENKPTKFAEKLTADHMILSEEEKSRHGDTCALVIKDRATQYLFSYGSPSKSTKDTKRHFQRFLGTKAIPQHIYTDNAPEFNKCMKDMGWQADTCTPHQPQTSGIAERAVRRVKGTRRALVQTGLSMLWCREAVS